MPISTAWFSRARGYASRLRGGYIALWLVALASVVLLLKLLLLLGLLTSLLTGEVASRGSGLAAILAKSQQGLASLGLARSPSAELLVLVLLGMVGIVALSWLRYLSLRVSRRLAEDVASLLRMELRRQALLVEAAELLCRRDLEAAELLTNRTEALKLGLAVWWSVLPRDVLLLGSLAAMALFAHPVVGLAAVLLASLGWLLLSRQEVLARQRQKLAAERAWRQMTALIDHLRQARVVGGALSEDAPGPPFRQLVEHYRHETLSEHAAESSTVAWAGVFAAAAAGMAVGLVGVKLLQDPPEMGLPVAAVLGATIACAYRPLIRLRRLPSLLERADLAAHDVFTYLDRASGLEQTAGDQPLPPLTEKLEFSGVTLMDHAGRKLLDDVSLEVHAGSRVALVSSDPQTPLTLACLLLRYKDPQQGQVQFNGMDVRHAALGPLRASTALLLQDGPIFSGTVSDNIRCGENLYSQEQVLEATRTAHCDEFIHALPQSFDTLLGEHAVRLPPQQMFHIALARTLLRSPAVVVMEEPEAGPDAAIAQQTELAIQGLTQGRTMLIIPSRLATLRSADRVFVFHEGKLCAQGTHAELLQASDLYRHLVYLRFTEVQTG